MKKQQKLKKGVALFLALLLVSSALIGCSSQDNKTPAGEDKNTSEFKGDESEKFVIGFPWDTASTDATWNSVYSHVKIVVEAAGGELITVDTDLSADSLISNIEELISRDVDGILFMPASDTMIPAVDAMCSEAGIYWGTFFRDIFDKDIKEQVYASKWYAGGCFEDDETSSSNLLKAMGGIGVTDVGIINIAKGDTSSDLRDKGAKIGAEENGINILNTSYSLETTNDVTKTVESYIAAYPEMNGIVLLGTYAPAAIPTIIKVIEDNGKTGEIKVGRIDFEVAMADQLKEGTFHVSYGGQQQIDPLMSTVILVNKVMGAPIVEDGPAIIITPYLELTSAEEAEQYNKYFLGDEYIYNPDEIQEFMIKKNNANEKEMDYDYFIDLVASFSIEDVVGRHSK